MAKVRVYKLRKPKFPTFTEDFLDALVPEEVFTLTVRPLVGFSMMSAMGALAEDLIETYVKGKLDEETGQRKPPAPVVDGQDEPIAVTEPLCQIVAQILVMQSPTLAEDDRYDAMELFIISEDMSFAFQDAFAWLAKVNNQVRGLGEDGEKKERTTPRPLLPDSSPAPASTTVTLTPDLLRTLSISPVES